MDKSTNQDEIERLCFVIMGFGKKTDFEAQITFDLDETYDEIIRPAVLASGFRCVRANEIGHSGVIDVRMYEMLLRADLVIADISTANPNAIYELGVRHALRPYSTIVIKEDQGKFHFDLNHLATLQYRHLGEEIGAKEARRASGILESLIKEITFNPRPDSPVYTFIPALACPRMSDEEFGRAVDAVEAEGEHLAGLIESAKKAANASSHLDAYKLFEKAANKTHDNSYLIQQWALHRYKSETPSAYVALVEARAVIEKLDVSKSRDPETLGIAGAITQRLWKMSKDNSFLDQAIDFYGNGYSLREDYYNGENYALCLEQRSLSQSDPAERVFDATLARKTRQKLVESLKAAEIDESFGDRSDRKWVYATLSSCLFSLGYATEAERYETLFRASSEADWETKSFERAKLLFLEYKSHLG
jgi:hypothetical protein